MFSIFFISNNKDRVLDEAAMAKIQRRYNLDFKYFPIYPEIFNLKPDLSTYQLLKQEETREFIKKKSDGRKVGILVFKNDKLIEKLCAKYDYKLLAPPAELTSMLENKISQAEFLHTVDIPRPFTTWGIFEDIDFYRVATKIKIPFVLQFGRGHSGDGSILIETQDQFRELAEKYPARDIRCTELLKGETGTINICLYKDNVIFGAPSIQITGVKELTKNALSTVGNDWAFCQRFFREHEIEKKFKNFLLNIGKKIRKIGYQGILGLDFNINVNDKKNMFKVIEINARFPATTIEEARLANKNAKPSLLAFHISAFIKSFQAKVESESSENEIPYYKRARLIKRDLASNRELKEKIFDTQVYLGNQLVNKNAINELSK